MGLAQEATFYDHAPVLLPAEQQLLGKTLIVAPHQDDESLGCGGIIYLLKQMDIPVHVVFVTDGSKSHPNSKKYPFEKLVSLRENESVEALAILGVGKNDITFLRLQDGRLPTAEAPDFQDAVNAFKSVLNHFEPKTIFTPWQRDPHPDHRATWQIVNQAVQAAPYAIRKFEYFIWLWERAGSDDLPVAGEGKIWKVDIEIAQDYKKTAVEAYLSQTTSLIDDDPEGFTLSPEVLAHFDNRFEIFLER
ncbi:PIG-L deacetylase family protein [Dyadobacter sp. CY347]|uniref:PIG-L deacetylase family protein n=1 Tax=Dyadobacter sp. CY347 TaxID=2909336 RepID=UPI001F4277FB|nr:PIG-L family deacetylase [Dyadobacter sp. CY347]MCF2489194.1 PIG-L family deacetylase [Dyadobacter sp. CY347]